MKSFSDLTMCSFLFVFEMLVLLIQPIQQEVTPLLTTGWMFSVPLSDVIFPAAGFDICVSSDWKCAGSEWHQDHSSQVQQPENVGQSVAVTLRQPERTSQIP